MGRTIHIFIRGAISIVIMAATAEKLSDYNLRDHLKVGARTAYAAHCASDTLAREPHGNNRVDKNVIRGIGRGS